MRQSHFTPQARRDLIEIWSYIAQDNLDAADRVREAIEAAVQSLAEMPGKGHSRDDVPDKGIRFWSVFSYLIAYRYDEQTLVVVRIVHGARNLRRILEQ